MFIKPPTSLLGLILNPEYYQDSHFNTIYKQLLHRIEIQPFNAIAYFFDWNTTIAYLNSINYIEPIFFVVVMIIAGSLPILKFAKKCLHVVAKMRKSIIESFWWTLLRALFGSLIKEPTS